MKSRVFDGAAMRARREALGLTRPELSLRSGISVSYLKALELEPPTPGRPSMRLARDLVRALRCQIEDLSHPAPLSVTDDPLEISA